MWVWSASPHVDIAVETIISFVDMWLLNLCPVLSLNTELELKEKTYPAAGQGQGWTPGHCIQDMCAPPPQHLSIESRSFPWVLCEILRSFGTAAMSYRMHSQHLFMISVVTWPWAATTIAMCVKCDLVSRYSLKTASSPPPCSKLVTLTFLTPSLLIL